jgi:hypothetical protein
MEATLYKSLQDFMSVTAKSTVAIVIPLYGFWADIPDNPVNGQVLSLVLNRLYSNSNMHQLYFIFVAHPQSLPNDPKDPKSVSNILMRHAKMGNTKNIPVGRDATYAEYVREGMEYAINETQAQFIVVFNPWTLIQHGGLDVLIDRCNRADDAKIVSGFDLRSVIEGEQFDSYKNNTPSEDWDLTFNFVAMPRYAAEGITLDPEYQTHAFLERDVWQQAAGMNYAVIASQRIPIFPFDFPWSDYETRESFEADRAHFAAKWRFDPGINYADPRGANRADKGGTR